MTEFFRKLEIKAPAYYEIINGDRVFFETEIQALIEEEFGGELEWITFWGEGRYACGNVIRTIDEEKYVVVLGMYKMKDKKEQPYKVTFIPTKKGIKQIRID